MICGPLDQDHPLGAPRGKVGAGLGVDGLDRRAGQRPAHRPRPVAGDLAAVGQGDVEGDVHRGHRRHLGRPVTFERLEVELLADLLGRPGLELLGAEQQVVERGVLLGLALDVVAREGGRRGDQRHLVLSRRGLR